MAGIKLPYSIKSCEIACYNVSKYFISRGYMTDVNTLADGAFCVYIYQERMIKNIIGTPTVVKATFYPLDGATGIEVKVVYVKVTVGNVVKEVLSTALVLPGVVKIGSIFSLKKKVKERTIIEAQKLKTEEKVA